MLALVFVYAFVLGAGFAATVIVWTSDYWRYRRQKRLENCTRLGRLAIRAESAPKLLAGSNAIDLRSHR